MVDGSDLSAGQFAAMQRQLDAALTECQRLQEETKQLRARLGLSVQPSFQRVPPGDLSQQLFIQSASLPSVNEHSSLDQKIALRMLFRGREDVYPVLWENKQTGRKFYVPAVNDGVP
jgi:hypothetical protein